MMVWMDQVYITRSILTNNRAALPTHKTIRSGNPLGMRDVVMVHDQPIQREIRITTMIILDIVLIWADL